ncbi:hypothetical protein J7E93_01860 [Streptomyces sp. ISL-36]|uniref:hypothetical protein n=1 Tax=Streptomyces sp. ISL-36 TaxID=2819182 RepID=UPI001BE89B38|nr:hypothetical protein [Streptomyces sp. ISL-36]MBT2438891.1 hypothetical protein [Streptomyces sp. ISL-36]
MSRSFRRIGALGACVIAAAAFNVPVSATTAQAQDLDFTVYAKEVPGQDEGQGESERPPAVGDGFSFTEDIYRTKGGEKVGRDGITCTVVRAGNPSDLLCVGTFVLSGDPRGQLTAQALVAFDPSDEQPAPFDVALTGGTGDFEAARGTVHSTPDGDYQRLDFHVIR